MRKLWNILNSPIFDLCSGIIIYLIIPFVFDIDNLDFNTALVTIFCIVAIDCVSHAIYALFVRSRRGHGGKP